VLLELNPGSAPVPTIICAKKCTNHISVSSTISTINVLLTSSTYQPCASNKCHITYDMSLSKNKCHKPCVKICISTIKHQQVSQLSHTSCIKVYAKKVIPMMYFNQVLSPTIIFHLQVHQPCTKHVLLSTP
jgi:hypothetical protein